MKYGIKMAFYLDQGLILSQKIIYFIERTARELFETLLDKYRNRAKFLYFALIEIKSNFLWGQ
jgi:hypothetical protein